MNKLLFVFLLWLPSRSLAQSGIGYVQEIAYSTATIESIYIASAPATNVTTTTVDGVLNGAFAVEVYNLSGSTSTINCGFDSMVSVSTANAKYGREIPAGVGVVFQVMPNKLNLFCATQNTGGVTRATITQLR